MENWIEEAAQRCFKEDAERREQALIEHTLYLRKRAMAPYFWRAMREAIETNIAGLNNLSPHSLWQTVERRIVKVASSQASVEIGFNEIIPMIIVEIWRRPRHHLNGDIPTRKLLKFKLRDTQGVSDVWASGEDGEFGAPSAAEYVLDLALNLDPGHRTKSLL